MLTLILRGSVDAAIYDGNVRELSDSAASNSPISHGKDGKALFPSSGREQGQFVCSVTSRPIFVSPAFKNLSLEKRLSGFL